MNFMPPGAVLPVTETTLDMSNIDLRDALREIDEHTWLVGDRLVVRRLDDTAHVAWTDDLDRKYEVVKCPSPMPPSMPLPFDKTFQRSGYDGPMLEAWVEDQYAVFNFGTDARLKVTQTHPSHRVTSEKTTLEWLPTQGFSFQTPRLLHVHDDGHRQYVFTGCVRGRTVNEAWPTMSIDQRRICIERIAGFCKEMATSTSRRFGGVDRGWLFDHHLDIYNEPIDYSTMNLVSNCTTLGMNRTPYVFAHNNLNPNNVYVDIDANGEFRGFGIINWEMGGFVPAPWVMTKFKGSMSLNTRTPGGMLKPTWGHAVAKKLDAEVFEDFSAAYIRWVRIRRPENYMN